MANYYPATPYPMPFFDPDTGELLSGGTLEAYRAQSSTPVDMYSDKNGTSAGDTITLNAGGYPQVSGTVIVIHLKTSVDYKFILKDSAGNQIWSADDISNLFRQVAFSRTYDTLADAVADTSLQEGDHIEWLEHTEGTGYEGGNTGVMVSAGTGTADNGSYIDHSGGALQIKALFSSGIYNPLQFGADPTGATSSNTALKSMITAAGTCGKIEIPEGTFIVNERLSALEGQEWNFRGWLKLDTDGDTSVSGVLNLGSAPNAILKNPLLDADRQNNTAKPGSGSFATLSCNVGGSNAKVYGGIIKNGLHNNLQASSPGFMCFGTVFENSGEHCLYLNNTGNAAGSAAGMRFVTCQFNEAGQDSAGTHSEAHYVQGRNLDDAEFIGCTADGMAENMNGSAFNFTDSRDVLVKGGSYKKINHWATIDDANCERITYESVTFDRDGVTINAGSPARSSGTSIKHFNCKYVGGWAQTSTSPDLGFHYCEFEMSSRFEAVDLQKFHHCEFTQTATFSTTGGFMRATDTDGGFSIKDCTIYSDNTTGIYVTSGLGAGADSKLYIDGLELPDFTGSNAVNVDVGASHSIKGVRCPSSGSSIIVVGLGVSGKHLVAENEIPSGGMSLEATANITEYGNITSAT